MEISRTSSLLGQWWNYAVCLLIENKRNLNIVFKRNLILFSWVFLLVRWLLPIYGPSADFWRKRSSPEQVKATRDKKILQVAKVKKLI